jgi:SAM-dependent methyltransferase
MWRAIVVGLVLAACTRPSLDEDAVKAKSHAFLDATDRSDADALSPMLGRSFVRFEQGRTRDRTGFLDGLRASHAPVATRTWNEEHVTLGDGTATFIGDAVDHFPAANGTPAMDLEFWDSVVWTREGSEWTVAYWQIERIPSARETWNEAFKNGVLFQKDPNQLLVDTVHGAPPGAALDVAMGEGRNAIYLASLGWKVTGIDISDEGIRIANENAAKRKLTIDAVQADMDTWDFGKDRWDLVTMIYAGADPKMVERIKPSLRHGGLFVVEVFHSDATGGKRSGFAKGELAAMFRDGFTIVRDDVVMAHPDWGPPNDVPLVRFVARRQ